MKKIFCFDIDGVIASITPNNNYNHSVPIVENINIVNKLFYNDNKIFALQKSNPIVFFAREIFLPLLIIYILVF